MPLVARRTARRKSSTNYNNARTDTMPTILEVLQVCALLASSVCAPLGLPGLHAIPEPRADREFMLKGCLHDEYAAPEPRADRESIFEAVSINASGTEKM